MAAPSTPQPGTASSAGASRRANGRSSASKALISAVSARQRASSSRASRATIPSMPASRAASSSITL